MNKVIFLTICALAFAGCSKKVVRVQDYSKARPVTVAAVPVPAAQEIPAPAIEPPQEPPYVPGVIYFDFDRADVTAAAAAVLAEIAKRVGDGLLIVGHCDERGSDAYNVALGQRRADAAHGWLKSAGVPLEKIRTESAGKRNPKMINCVDEECHAKNRYDEFILK